MNTVEQESSMQAITLFYSKRSTYKTLYALVESKELVNIQTTTNHE